MPSVPHDNPNNHSQTELTDISDEDFQASWLPPKISCCARFGQILLFIFTLGLLRLSLMIVCNILYLILMLPVVIFANKPSVIKHLSTYGVTVTRGYIRFMLLCLGIVWIKKNGRVDKSARNLVYNHTSCVDGPIIYAYQPFSVVGFSGLRDVFYFGRILIASNAVFIDRSKQGGNSHLIQERMEDHSQYPVAIAPEGKISNGTILFKFRSGGFIADEPIQPVTIRYHMCWTWCNCTYNWLQDGFLDWVFGALCIPFGMVTINFLDTLRPEDMTGMTPQRKAEIAQLDMANNLGVLAINRTAREIFVHRDEEPEPTPQLEQPLT